MLFDQKKKEEIKERHKAKKKKKLKRFTRQFDRSFLVFILALFSRQAVRAIYKPAATSQTDRAQEVDLQCELYAT